MNPPALPLNVKVPTPKANVHTKTTNEVLKAPVVAAAFHPSLATVGVLLAVFGYAIGTVAAILCTVLMQLASGA